MPPSEPNSQDLIERFLAAYNRIDAELRHRLKQDTHTTFSRVVDDYAAKHKYWPDALKLKRYGDLRNALTHGPTQPYEILAVPTHEVVEDVEQVYTRLSEKVFPRFQRKVQSFRDDATLTAALELIAQTNFSQFPVYAQDGKFSGLLTENGITRWLAHNTNRSLSLVDFDEVPIADVLTEQETHSNHSFAARTTPLDNVVSAFGRNPLLEAVLVTQGGKSSDTLLGIVTRWDVLNYA